MAAREGQHQQNGFLKFMLEKGENLKREKYAVVVSYNHSKETALVARKSSPSTPAPSCLADLARNTPVREFMMRNARPDSDVRMIRTAFRHYCFAAPVRIHVTPRLLSLATISS